MKFKGGQLDEAANEDRCHLGSPLINRQGRTHYAVNNPPLALSMDATREFS